MPDASNKKIVEDLLKSYSREELVWLSGYVSGLLAANPSNENSDHKTSSKKLTIAYGTESGNSKQLAAEFAAKAKKKGLAAKMVGLDQYRLNDLQKEEYFLTIVSTQGEGDPPAAARKFYDHIHNNGFQLERLKYSVLALGDTSYPLFCKAGEDVDAQLHKLGGQRLIPLQKCDTDYRSDADIWFEQVLEQLDGVAIKNPVQPVPKAKTHGKRIYNGTVLSIINLNDRGSSKQTFHIEIGADGVDYLPGDALGVVPVNPASLVKSILDIAGISPEQLFIFREQEDTAFSLLSHKTDLVYLPDRVVKKYGALVEQTIPEARMGLYDLLRIYPLQNSSQFQFLINLLEPITPRLYSIASAPAIHENEVHITVAKNEFYSQDEIKYGLCSDYLSAFNTGAPIQFYIHPNHLFRLPEPQKDIIMIGPGTGIAPFRSFLYQRDATGATGRNWLFFGEQHFITDFLYQTEVQQWLDTGTLHRIDLAFSRDQAHKIYVQDKIRKNGDEFYRWIENGAIVYVCGSKDPMSRDVEQTILEVIQVHGKVNEEMAKDLLIRMKEEGRWLMDVY